MIRYFLLPGGSNVYGNEMSVELMRLDGDTCRKLESRYPGYEVDEFITIEAVIPLMTKISIFPPVIDSDGAEVVPAWVTDEAEARERRINDFLKRNRENPCQHQF